MWPDRRLLDTFKIEHPIVLAPMAGAMDTALAIAVAQGGGLGSLPVAMLDEAKMRAQVAAFRAATADAPLNLNFFAHKPPMLNNAREDMWRERLKPYYIELKVDPAAPVPSSNRRPFDAVLCAAVEDLKPTAVSFHFGLPDAALLARVKGAGAIVMGSATTVEEARYLEAHGCDVVIAQGFEAGGHRGMFLTENPATQVGTFALLPQIVDAVKLPVIAAGAIADARGIVAALALGASAVQIGTSYLLCPESTILPPHRAALKAARDDGTALTNVMSGRLARGILNRAMRELGPISDAVPEFPLAAGALAPLHAVAQASGSGDFSTMWAGQAGALAREVPARDLTRRLAEGAQALMAQMAGQSR